VSVDDPLIPRRYLRLAVALAIIIVLTGSGLLVVNYALTIVAQRQRATIAEAARVALQAHQLAEQRAAQVREAWLNETVTVTLQNHTSADEALWTATPAGTNADGSTTWTYNEACVATSWQDCSASIYDHRGIMIHGSGTWSANNPNWPWQVVQTSDMTLTAIPVNP
jgi:hypothetical protein